MVVNCRSAFKTFDPDIELDTTASRKAHDLTDGSFSETSSVVGIKKNHLHVRFNSIQIRNYNITLGDNPSCRQGPPVTLDWSYDEMEPISIDSYEEERENPPRKLYQMYMQSRQRANLLKISAGITDDEMIAFMDDIHTLNMKKMALPLSNLQNALVSAWRKWQGSCTNVSDDYFLDTSSVAEIKKNHLHVKFNSIQIRNYDITLGDNPSCKYGPPIALDWSYIEMEPISIDSYEEKRRNPPRKKRQMLMQSRNRANLLKISAGVTDDELASVMDELRKIQKQRNMTRMTLPLMKLQDAAESASRKWQRFRNLHCA